MKVYDRIISNIGKKKMHMTLIDPATSGVEGSVKIAKEAERAGTDFLLIGGSTHLTITHMDQSAGRIKRETGLPLIVFPGSASMFTRLADAIFFMSLLNSRDREFIMDHQVQAAKIVRDSGIESISMGYIIFEPGMTVGKVGKANLIRKDESDLAVSYALTAELLGMSMVYLEAGSGAVEHISLDIIRNVKKHVKIPVIVGGGIKGKPEARAIADAGADIIVTGTIAEKATDIYSCLRPIIDSIR
jgi:phosphoglycerol geranylgeranyltransferase